MVCNFIVEVHLCPYEIYPGKKAYVTSKFKNFRMKTVQDGLLKLVVNYAEVFASDI